MLPFDDLGPRAAYEAPDRGPMVIGVMGMMIALATISFSLHLWIRMKRRVRMGADDFTLGLSYLALWAHFTIITVEVKHGGLGKPISVNLERDPNILPKYFKMVYAQLIMSPILVTIVKVSFLAMYLRFFPTKFMRWSSVILGIIMIAWCFSVVFPSIWQCQPIYKYWNPTMKTGTCSTAISLWLAWIDSVPALATDIALFILPLVEIRRLHASRSTKSAISGIFLLSFLSIVGRIIMLVQGYKASHQGQNMDITYDFAEPVLWCHTELSVGFLCNCIPSFRPILTMILARTGISKSENSQPKPDKKDIITFGRLGRDGSGGKYLPKAKRSHPFDDSTILSATQVEGSFERLDDHEAPSLAFLPDGYHSNYKSYVEGGGNNSNQNIPLEAIAVRKDFHWKDQYEDERTQVSRH